MTPEYLGIVTCYLLYYAVQFLRQIIFIISPNGAKKAAVATAVFSMDLGRKNDGLTV